MNGNAPINNINHNWERAIAYKLRSAVSVNPQQFTEEEKAQARENIGVDGSGNDPNAVHFTEQSLTSGQKEQARTNIDAWENRMLVSSLTDIPQDFSSQSYENAATLLGITGAQMHDLIHGKYTHIRFGSQYDNETLTVVFASKTEQQNGPLWVIYVEFVSSTTRYRLIESSMADAFYFLESSPLPDVVEANPTVPAGTTPTEMTGLRIGSSYFSVPDPTALTDNEIDTIWTNAMS